MCIEIYKKQNEYEKMAKSIYYMFDDSICIFEWDFLYKYESIGYVLDYLYFIRVVETNSFRLNTIPTLDKNKYI